MILMCFPIQEAIDKIRIPDLIAPQNLLEWVRITVYTLI